MGHETWPVVKALSFHTVISCFEKINIGGIV